jgi:hypothetical protein
LSALGRCCGWATFPAVLALAAGCAEELGPEPMITTTVTGVVREGHRPVGGGWIEFVPIAGSVGVLRSAPIQPDGRFVVERVAVGMNGIGLLGAPITIPGGRRFFDPLNAPIQRVIPHGPNAEVSIDLIEEYVRFQSQQAAADER